MPFKFMYNINTHTWEARNHKNKILFKITDETLSELETEDYIELINWINNNKQPRYPIRTEVFLNEEDTNKFLDKYYKEV